MHDNVYDGQMLKYCKFNMVKYCKFSLSVRIVARSRRNTQITETKSCWRWAKGLLTKMKPDAGGIEKVQGLCGTLRPAAAVGLSPPLDLKGNRDLEQARVCGEGWLPDRHCELGARGTASPRQPWLHLSPFSVSYGCSPWPNSTLGPRQGVLWCGLYKSVCWGLWTEY